MLRAADCDTIAARKESIVYITREGIIQYWLTEPVRDFREGFIRLDAIPFPDLEMLTTQERDAIRPVLQRHPEYVLEIWCKKTIH